MTLLIRSTVWISATHRLYLIVVTKRMTGRISWNDFLVLWLTLQYTCQLFLRYKREIFILEVLGFLKTTRSFPKVPEEVRSLPKKSENFWRRPKTSEGEVIESQSQDAYKRELAPSAFHFKNQRSRGRYCHLFILQMVFVPYMGLS